MRSSAQKWSVRVGTNILSSITGLEWLSKISMEDPEYGVVIIQYDLMKVKQLVGT